MEVLDIYALIVIYSSQKCIIIYVSMEGSLMEIFLIQ